MKNTTPTTIAPDSVDETANALGVMAAGVLPAQLVSAEPTWLLGGGATGSGVTVTHDTALNFSAYFDSVRIISEDIGKLSYHVFERMVGGAGRKRDDSHPARRVIAVQANPETTANVLRETMTANALVSGNGYSEIVHNRKMEPVELWHIDPWRVRPTRTRSGRLVYDVSNDRGPNTVMETDRMLHLRGFGFDGVKGCSVASLAAESLGIALAAERYQASFFGNGAVYSGVLEHPNKLDDKQLEQIRGSHTELHSGPSQGFKLMILQNGAKLSKWGMSMADAQMLTTRKFQAEEMARWFRIPPHKLGLLDKASLSNIEEQSIEYVVDTLLSWAVRWDSEIGWKLFSENERGRFFSELMLDTLLRGDRQSRFNSYHSALQDGWMNRDEVRQRENFNPMPDEQGEVFLFPLNMAPAQQVIEGESKTPPPPAANPGGDNNVEPQSPPDNRGRKLAMGHALKRVAGAQSHVLEHEIKRVFAKQAKACSRARSKAGDDGVAFTAWCDNFFGDLFASDVRCAVSPGLSSLFEMFCMVTGEPADTGAMAVSLAQTFADAHCLSSKRTGGVAPDDITDVARGLAAQACNLFMIQLGEHSHGKDTILPPCG